MPKYPAINVATGGGRSATWGSITGELRDQADLALALDAKANVVDVDAAIDALSTAVAFSYFLEPKTGDGTLSAAQSVAFLVAPHGMTITGVQAALRQPSAFGDVVLDVNVGGVSILGPDRITISADKNSSKASGTLAEILLPMVMEGVDITVDIDDAGLGAEGLVVTLTGIRTEVAGDGVLPENAVQPQMGGDIYVSGTATLSSSIWSGGPWGFGYEWLRDGTVVAWTSGPNYVLVPEDAGHLLKGREFAANVNGGKFADSVAMLVPVPKPQLLSAPIIPLTIFNGFQVETSNGVWLYNPTSYQYQWQINTGSGWTTYDGKVSKRFSPIESDVGASVRCRLIAINGTAPSDPVYSNEVVITLSRFSQPWPPAVKALDEYVDPTAPLVGSNRTFNVGPGKEYADLKDVPWLSLTAGDVVNIFWRATPYNTKFAITGVGTAEQKIIIHGVMTLGGLRPILSGDGCETAQDAIDAGFLSAAYTENLGLIFIHRHFHSGVPIKPKHIRIENLEIRDAFTGSNFTDQFGGTRSFGEGAGGVYAVVVENLEIENCEIHNNSNGIFTNTKDDDEDFASYFIYIRRNSIYGNGEVGSTYIHNVYSQAVRVLYEGNYIGQLRDGAIGSTFKDRSSATVVRYNRIHCAARGADFVDTEGGATSVKIDPLYPYAWCYGNLIINDWKAAPAKASSAAMIHWSSDHESPRNGTLYFYQNTVVVRADTTDFYHIGMFDCSTAQSRVEASGNIMVRYGNCAFNLGSAGVVIEFKGTNWITSGWTAINGAGPSTVTQSGTLIEGADPGLNGSFEIIEGSPVMNKGLVAYDTFPSPATVESLQVTYQPDGLGSLKLRAPLGTDSDLGCFETDVGVPDDGSGGTGPALEPDGSGYFNFLTDGAFLSALNPKWSTGAATYVCDGGYLRLVSAYHGEVARFVDTAIGADQSITVVRKGQTWDNASDTIFLNLQDNGSGAVYSMWVMKGSMQLRKSGGGSLSYATPTIDWTADTPITVSIVGGVVKLFINGTEIVAAGYTDPSPLTGGYPSFQIGDNGSTTAHYFDSLTFNL